LQTPDFTTFFLASAGAGAALVGLLFVIIYGLEVVHGWQYLSHGGNVDYAYNIAYLVIAAYGAGLTRA
jgi:hypothetical protein